MKVWHIGFVLLAAGVAIPVIYGLYEFVLVSVPWYFRLSVLLVLAGVVVLLASAIRDRMNEETPERRV
jgi:hypothetical protein